jgi:hypothetical protein
LGLSSATADTTVETVEKKAATTTSNIKLASAAKGEVINKTNSTNKRIDISALFINPASKTS